MKSPLASEPWRMLDTTDSTQLEAGKIVLAGDREVSVIFALEQTAGKGRFERQWISPMGDCVAMSLIFWDYANHPKPWLIGMASAIAVAAALHARLQWPNDVVLNNKKLGGILTEIIVASNGDRIPVVGIGVNLNQTAFPPEIEDRATSLAIHRPGSVHDPVRVAKQIGERMELLPEPDDWSLLQPAWMNFDATPGKHYRLPDGEEAVGIGLGPQGELICAVQGETQSVLAADAILG